MKKLFLIALALMPVLAFAQNKETKKLLASIEGQWQLNDENQLEYTEVVEIPGVLQDDMFIKAKNYFVYNYNSGKDVIQSEARDRGMIIGKGIWPDVHVGYNLVTTKISAFHLLRVDCKDGKARVIITVTDYDIEVISSGSSPSENSQNPISSYFPIYPKGMSKTVYGKAFYKTHMKALETIKEVAEALKDGNNIPNANDDW